jgi:hypothetical protein
MMKTNNKKKGSTAKKLLPATMMLAVSASMLATSTYAWFTMSREVEVKNIQMTATTPEDIQISLGHLTSPTKGYVDNTGTLTKAGGDNADNGNVLAPNDGNNSTDMLDWSNTVDISNYYLLGKILPASSYNGASIYFTPDSNGVGQTLSDGAKFYTAANGLTATTEASATHGGDAGTGSLMTTLHAKTASNDTWTGKLDAIGWNNTKDDGYYVDIPVWLRTSSQTAQNITVDAYVIPKGASTSTAAVATDRDLYKAVRVAILDTSGNTSKLLGVKDGLNRAAGDDQYKVLASPYEATNTVFTEGYYNRAAAPSSGKNAVSAVSAEGTNSPTYADAVMYNNTVRVAQLAAGNGTTYGTATKLIIRVWLEGEDVDCWNANAGQDFSINLKFSKGGTDPA